MEPKLSEQFQFWLAATEGNLPVVKNLSINPAVDINWPDSEHQRTPFYRACGHGRTETVKFMLGLEGIDLNLGQKDGATPFCIACQNGRAEVVLLLLADLRVDVNKPANDNTTALCIASTRGHVSIVKLLLACGREIDTKQISNFKNMTAAEEARSNSERTEEHLDETDEDFQRSKANGPSIADLIEAFEKDPVKVRAQLRRDLYEPLTGELFALVVFLSDGYLEIQKDPPEDDKGINAHKFFTLIVQLPMDLQMVLCNRVFGFRDSIIKRDLSEKGFQKFAKGF